MKGYFPTEGNLHMNPYFIPYHAFQIRIMIWNEYLWPLLQLYFSHYRMIADYAFLLKRRGFGIELTISFSTLLSSRERCNLALALFLWRQSFSRLFFNIYVMSSSEIEMHYNSHIRCTCPLWLQRVASNFKICSGLFKNLNWELLEVLKTDFCKIWRAAI